MAPGERRAGDDGERAVEARHRRDRVVEAEEQRVLDVDAAVGERVDEPVERPRRCGRQEVEDRQRTEVRGDGGAPLAVVVGVAPAEREREPAGREGHVADGIPGRGDVQRAGEAERDPLDERLDVEPRALLERDEPLGVPPRPRAAVPLQREPAAAEVEAVRAEAEDDLAPGRERASRGLPADRERGGPVLGRGADDLGPAVGEELQHPPLAASPPSRAGGSTGGSKRPTQRRAPAGGR